MNEVLLQDIYIYPIKSLGGISLTHSRVIETGLEYDRRWMLIDETGSFLSQRTHAQMAMLTVELSTQGLIVGHKTKEVSPKTIPFDTKPIKEVKVKIWEDECMALQLDEGASTWFSKALGIATRLVYMPAATKRLVDNFDATNNDIVSFADAYPVMIIGQSSLDELNKRLEHPVLMNRFRPNLVFSGGEAHCEDRVKTFQMNEVIFDAVEPCSRCNLITINQEDGSKGKEPSRTLATYRKEKNKILFGQNLLIRNRGSISVGEKIKIIAAFN